jgi:magnesium transporter
MAAIPVATAERTTGRIRSWLRTGSTIPAEAEGQATRGPATRNIAGRAEICAMPRHKSEVLEAEDHTRGITLRVPCMTEISEERIRGALARNHFFWLDLADPGAGEIERLGELFGFHPIAIEDTLHFGQRPKLDDFGNYVFLVFYGASERRYPDGGRLSEFHLFVSGSYLITVHRDPAPSLDEQRSSIEGRVLHSEQFVIYRVLDALTDTFFPTLSEMDETIDELEDGIIANPTGEQLQRIF